MKGAVVRLGVLTPHAAAGPEEEFPAMAPGRLVTRVVRVAAAAGAADAAGGPPPPGAARQLTGPPLLDEAAADLAAGADAVQAIGFASTSTGYAIGFDGESALVGRLSRRARVPVTGTGPAAVAALRVLGVERVALVHPPWFDADVNALGAEYFRSQGLDVVFSASAGLVPDPPRIEAGAVVDWVSRHVPDTAEAVYLGGNGFRTVAAVEALEAGLGRPVLTANQVLLWSLLALAGATSPVTGYGRLFTYGYPSA
ncbi:MAG: maleate cis-trans isomerase [Mycobacteriales bacterium]